jgi:hypothetical protein
MKPDSLPRPPNSSSATPAITAQCQGLIPPIMAISSTVLSLSLKIWVALGV